MSKKPDFEEQQLAYEKLIREDFNLRKEITDILVFDDSWISSHCLELIDELRENLKKQQEILDELSS